jgi:ribosomal protein S27AE
MQKLPCPSCGERSFSAHQKLWLGPLRTIRCGKCGTRVSVSWGKSLFVLVLLSLAFPLGAVIGASFGDHLACPYALLVSGVFGGIFASAPLLFVYVHYVPFIARAA